MQNLLEKSRDMKIAVANFGIAWIDPNDIDQDRRDEDVKSLSWTNALNLQIWIFEDD